MPCGGGRAADDVPLELAEDRRSRCKRWDPNANIIYGELHTQCISTDCLGDHEKGVHWPEVIHAGDIHCADLEDGFLECQGCSETSHHDRWLDLFLCEDCFRRKLPPGVSSLPGSWGYTDLVALQGVDRLNLGYISELPVKANDAHGRSDERPDQGDDANRKRQKL